MANINAFTGVGVAGMSRTLHVAERCRCGASRVLGARRRGSRRCHSAAA